MNDSHLILVVDDDRDLREAIADVLGESGYKAITAASGMDALQILAQAETLPDVILLDMMMPVMDGWAFARAKQSLPRIAAIPLVVFTAHADGELNTSDLHATTCLRKPVPVGVLLKTLERLTTHAE